MPPKKGKPTPRQIAESFVKQYYKTLEGDRGRLFNYYNNDSQFLHQFGAAEGTSVVGKEKIKTAAFALFNKDTPLKVDYSCGTLDAQQGGDGGVVLLVTGTIATHPGEAQERVQTFVQTFFLAPSLTTAKSASYYVLNDTFRLLDAPKAVSALKIAAQPAPPTEAPVKIAAAAPLALKEAALAKEAALTKEAALKAEPAQPENEPSGPLTWAQRAAKDASKPKAKNEEGAAKPQAARAPPAAATSKAETKAPPVVKAEVPKAPKSEGGKAVTDPLSLYVKGLPEGTSEDQLRSAFERHGDIKSVSIKEDRGYAFVDFKAPESMQAALAAGVAQVGEVEVSVERRMANKAGGSRSKGSKGAGKGKGKGEMA